MRSLNPPIKLAKVYSSIKLTKPSAPINFVSLEEKPKHPKHLRHLKKKDNSLLTVYVFAILKRCRGMKRHFSSRKDTELYQQKLAVQATIFLRCLRFKATQRTYIDSKPSTIAHVPFTKKRVSEI